MSERDSRFLRGWLKFNDVDEPPRSMPDPCDCRHDRRTHDDFGKCMFASCRCKHYRPYIGDLDSELHRIFAEHDRDEAKQ